MKDFISEIKKIPTDGLIYSLSEKSIDMFRKNKYLMPVNIPVIHNGQRKITTVTLTAWDIPDIEFLSVKESDDDRDASGAVSMGALINLYRGYDNERSTRENIFQNLGDGGVFRILMGMTAEQFYYQNKYWILEKFNRDYYILLAATHFEHHSEVDVNAIVQEIFGISANDYILALLTIFALCLNHPDPLNAPKEWYCTKDNTSLTPKNLFKVVDYYSCTYEQLRVSGLKKQLLYSKPFIKTQRTKEYLATSAFLIAMLVGNGLYWLVRDYYCKQGTQEFVNAFGYLFEDYIKDVATKYCKPSEWTALETGSEKEADFRFDLGGLVLLVESKSSLVSLNVKQQIPDLKSADDFINRTIKKAHNQLNSSYGRLVSSTDCPIIKVILLYDKFSSDAIIEFAAGKILSDDPSCFIMTIGEFEILLYYHKNDKEKEQQILDELLKSIKSESQRKNISAIYTDLSINRNLHIENEIDYFDELIDHLNRFQRR